jgi:hypothetical protein
VKLGQAAACREDILSEAVAKELRKLCDQVIGFGSGSFMGFYRDFDGDNMGFYRILMQAHGVLWDFNGAS